MKKRGSEEVNEKALNFGIHERKNKNIYIIILYLKKKKSISQSPSINIPPKYDKLVQAYVTIIYYSFKGLVYVSQYVVHHYMVFKKELCTHSTNQHPKSVQLVN